MAGITTARGLAVAESAGLQRPGLALALTGLNPATSTLVAENVTFCAKKPLFYAARLSLSIAGFGPHRPGIGPTAASSDWNSARFVFRPRLGHAGRFSAPEVATCTNSCSKKVFEKRHDCGYTLHRYHLAQVWTSSTRHLRRAACSEANRRMRFCSRRGGIPEA